MSKRERLHRLLCQAYWKADNVTEFRAVQLLFIALGFGDPLRDTTQSIP